MNHRAIAVFLGAVMAGAIAAPAGVAQAAFYRVHSAACYNAQVSSTDIDTNFGITGDGNLVCAAPDSDTVPKSSFNTINVELWVPTGGSATSFAALCEDNWAGTGGACSPELNNGLFNPQTGLVTFGFGNPQKTNLGVWAPGSGNFGYVFVVPNGARLSGIFYSQ